MPVLDPYPSATVPYKDVAGRVSSNFWGSPVIQMSDGTLSCPGYTGATYSSRIWDFVGIKLPAALLSGSMQAKTPGACEVNCLRERDVDKKKKKGSDGARITLAGLEPATVDIKVTIWTPEQLKNFELLCAIIFPGRQKQTTTKQVPTGQSTTTVIGATDATPTADTVNRQAVTQTIPTAATKTVKTTKSVTVTQPFDVSHPVLDGQGVKSIVFIKRDGPDPGKAPGSKVFTLKAIEFSLPSKVNATTTPTGAVALGSTLDDTTGATPGSDTRNTDP